MKVRATAIGFHLRIREVGDEFDVPDKLFSKKWMESLEPKAEPAKPEAAKPKPATEKPANPEKPKPAADAVI